MYSLQGGEDTSTATHSPRTQPVPARRQPADLDTSLSKLTASREDSSGSWDIVPSVTEPSASVEPIADEGGHWFKPRRAFDDSTPGLRRRFGLPFFRRQTCAIPPAQSPMRVAAERDRQCMCVRRRESLRLIHAPLKTLSLAVGGAKDWARSLRAPILQHLRVICLSISVALLLHCMATMIGGNAKLVWICFMQQLKMMAWWIGLGALSSIGLGSGVHTGILFLYPHIYMITQSAEVCNDLSFDPSANMWDFRVDPATLFPCAQQLPDSEYNSRVTFWTLLAKTLPYAFFWGLGTALGELPPYAASFAAAQARKKEGNPTTLLSDLLPEETDGSKWGLVKKYILFGMVSLIEKYGGLAVFSLSCWPNALFDLCGIICGSSLMPFWVFFVPLVLGKAVVKIILQTSVAVFLFSRVCDEARARVVTAVAELPPLSYLIRWRFGELSVFEGWLVHETHKLRKGSATGSTASGWKRHLNVSQMLACVVYFILLMFVGQLIEQLAMSKQRDMDDSAWEAKWRSLLHSEERLQDAVQNRRRED